MLLALVLSVQATTATAASPNPCTDQMSTLCKISPFFCPGAYPADLQPGNGTVPCWPERTAPTTTRGTTRVVSRPSGVSSSKATSVTPKSSATRSDDDRTRGSFGLFGRALESR